jgi:hypothetical protein
MMLVEERSEEVATAKLDKKKRLASKSKTRGKKVKKVLKVKLLMVKVN